MSTPTATPVRAISLTPFHYHSLAVPSGTATLAAYLADHTSYLCGPAVQGRDDGMAALIAELGVICTPGDQCG